MDSAISPNGGSVRERRAFDERFRAAKNFWTLPRSKGNSSQQMKRFGRREIRKCVYKWRKLGKSQTMPISSAPLVVNDG